MKRSIIRLYVCPIMAGIYSGFFPTSESHFFVYFCTNGETLYQRDQHYRSSFSQVFLNMPIVSVSYSENLYHGALQEEYCLHQSRHAARVFLMVIFHQGLIPNQSQSRRNCVKPQSPACHAEFPRNVGSGVQVPLHHFQGSVYLGKEDGFLIVGYHSIVRYRAGLSTIQ